MGPQQGRLQIVERVAHLPVDPGVEVQMAAGRQPGRPGQRDALAGVDPITDPRWHALSRRDGASLFTAPPWLAAVCGTYGFTPRARTVDKSKRGKKIVQSDTNAKYYFIQSGERFLFLARSRSAGNPSPDWGRLRLP